MAHDSPYTARREGLVIKTLPLREADLIVHLFTADAGRVHAVARGARKSKKRFTGGLDLFDLGFFELERKSEDSELWTISGFDRTDVWLGLRQNLLAFALASLCLDIISVFAHHGDEESSISFAPLRDTLRFLNGGHGQPESMVRATTAFALRLLLDSGFDPLASDQLRPGTANYLRALREDRLADSEEGIADFARSQEALKDTLNFVERTTGSLLSSRRQLPRNLATLSS